MSCDIAAKKHMFTVSQHGLASSLRLSSCSMSQIICMEAFTQAEAHA